MQQRSNLRQHMALAIVILVLAIVLLALVFIPHPVMTFEGPGGPSGGQMMP